MDLRRLQGVALIVSAVIDLVGLIGAGTSPVRFLFMLGALLLIFGVLAIEPVQQAGSLDWVGIGLIVLAAAIALVSTSCQPLAPVHPATLYRWQAQSLVQRDA